MELTSLFMQTWKDNNIPDKWLKSPLSIKKFYPNSKYVLLTDKDIRDFMVEHFPEYLNTFDRLPMQINRADMIRYAWLYVNGGVYMDLDIELKRPIDDLLKNGDVFLPMDGFKYFSNFFMASQPKQKIWLLCLEEIKKRLEDNVFYITSHISNELNTLYIAGNFMITEVIKNYDKPITIIPNKIILPCEGCERLLNYQKPFCESEYVRSLEGFSWVTIKTPYKISCFMRYNKYYINYIILALFILLLIFIIILIKRKLF